MTNIHFIGGEKGGVGKSMTSRLLAQYFIDNNQPFTGFDTDCSHGTFSRFYGEYAQPLDPTDFTSLDQLIEAADAYPQQEILVDLAAQTRRWLDRWIKDCDGLQLFQDLNVNPFFWHVMDDSIDCLSLLARLLEAYGDSSAQVVIVQNFGRGEDFEYFQQSEVFQTAQTLGADRIVLNKLHPTLVRKIDINNCSFWAAANNTSIMSLAERKRVHVWLKHAYQQLDHILQAQTLEDVS